MKLNDLVSLCQRRGFIYQGSQLYGGLAGTWDYGPLGVELKRNLQNVWWQRFVTIRDDIYGLDSAILMNSGVWQASGHTEAGFADPLVEDLVSRQRYRADQWLEELGHPAAGLAPEALDQLIAKHQIKSPAGNPLSPVRQFNMMFATHIGATAGEDDLIYLRPETAQGMFVNFKNVVDSLQPDLPFGLAQVGKAFRNEISPRDFVFRSREFEQMEIEYFCRPEEKDQLWSDWVGAVRDFLSVVGVDHQSVKEVEVPASERAHYSRRTIDFEFVFPFGQRELCGLADRGDFDLANHQRASGKNLEYIDKNDQARIQPHCLEPTFGVDRLILAILVSSYTVDEVNGRVYLDLPNDLAPVRWAVSPLLANKPELVAKARAVYDQLLGRGERVAWDASGNIGKRYRRQDEVGTPACLVIDHQTLDDGTVTVRDRNSLKQTRQLPDKLTSNG